MISHKSAQQVRNFVPADSRSGLYDRDERPGPALLRAILHVQGTGAPSRTPLILTFLLAIATTMALSSASAFATRGYVFSKFFGSGPCVVGVLEPCEEEFDEPSGVALNQATGEVYVIDAGNDRVEYFTSEGVYQGEFNASGTDLVVEGAAAPTGQFQFSSFAGAAEDQPVSGIAVDNDAHSPSFGDVYVTDVGHGVIDKFSSTGHYQGQVTGTCEKEKETPSSCAGFTPFVAGYGGLKGIAVDSNGELWVAQHEAIDNFSGAVANEFLASRKSKVEFEDLGPGFAVDSGDNLYVNPGFGLVDKLNSSGEILIKEEETKGRVAAAGIAVDPAGDAYIGAGSSVGVFNPTGVPTFNPFNSGTLIERFGSEQLTDGGAAGVAVDSGSGPAVNRYVADSLADEVFIYSPEPFAGPGLGGEWASDVSSDSATLGAQINPVGSDTQYYFQYGTVSCTASPSSCTDVPLPPPGADIGSEFGVQSVRVSLQGLEPSTVYHYRVIAHNSFGGGNGSTVEGPDQIFTTQGHGGPLVLPDGRAWELVSPVQKLGAQVGPPGAALVQAAEDGSAISYTMGAPFVANPAGNTHGSQALSRRGGEGRWSTEDIALPIAKLTSIGYGQEYKVFSADLSSALVEPPQHNPLAPGGEFGSFYVRDDSTGTYTLLTGSAGQWYEEMVKHPSDEAVERESGREKCETNTDPADGNRNIGESDSGCIAYFVSSAVLASGGSSGADNLYVAAGNSTGEWTVSFIAPLSPGANASGATGDAPDWEAAELYPGTKTVEVSPNGRYLAFMSDRSLTGYDNRDASSGEPDEEVYRFHDEPGSSAGGSLVCASCDPTGARPAGWLELRETLADSAEFAEGAWAGRWVAATIPGMTEVGPRFSESEPGKVFKQQAYYQPRYMLDDGRLFFDSRDALVPQDVNGTEDVYEYESGGVGSCPASSSGCVALLSGGTGPGESAFADASSSGDDVFFVTAEKLAAQDLGNEYDMYDAHVCGAEAPCPASLAQSPPPCTNEASCRAPQALQPGVFGPSGSATFSGPGNPPPPGPAAVKPVVKSLTNAQKLAKALKACRKKPKKKRASCRKQARKRYGASKAKKSAKGRKQHV